MALKMAFTDIAEAKAALSKVLELMNSPANREKLGPLLEECKGDPAKRTTVVRAPRRVPTVPRRRPPRLASRARRRRLLQIVPILQELFGVMLKEFNFPNGVDSEDPAEKKKKNGQGVMCAMMAFNAIVTANPDDAELKTGAAARSRRRRRRRRRRRHRHRPRARPPPPPPPWRPQFSPQFFERRLARRAPAAKELALAALQGELPDEAAVADIVTKLRA